MLLANSLIGGAFGFLRKSIGSVTYSTSTANRDGRRKQIARQKATQVKNPNTVAQIMQRMKLTPAQRFYDAYEKVVSKGIMSHSWEGISYGGASRHEFMSRAMKNSAAVYVPKGYNAFAPGEYEVSAGSLPSWEWRNDLGTGETPPANDLLDMNSPMTVNAVTKLLGFGLQLGDQISIIGATEVEGLYSPFAGRIIVGAGNTWQLSGALPAELYILTNGVSYDEKSQIAAVAVIVSRGQDSNAKRSNSQMLLLGEYKNLISAEALNAAIASYENGEAVTSLGSDWYLNNTPLTGQAVAGTAKVMQIEAEKADGTKVTRSFFVIERVSNGQIGYVVPTEAGGDSDFAYVQDGETLKPGNWPATEEDPNAQISGEQVARGLINAGLISLGYIEMTAAIAAQGGFTIAE